ncbi:restriction endonuclease subunit S [Bacillus weihaiensis]|uniref:Type I restriction modification DNA specificity domain-containing protein n=1 Tax=Bacillus weihaiensis TaxID=1547283 RepID=A0A1L3MP94_9BACI|nr:restriction endonuclease subunit S [Bacillus weihaiensis]APH04170.1 hypothetical protein A9C19_05110 [Bacillus weihaiensis]
MSKKKKTIEDLFNEAIVLVEEEPYLVPKNWVWTKLGKVGNYYNGRAFKPTEWSDKGRPIIRIQDLTGTNKGEPNYFVGQVAEKHEITKGDLLISWSATLGAYIWNGADAVLNQHIFKVESFIDKKYHYFAMQQFISSLYSKTHGSGMVHVTKKVFDETPFPLPPLNEQKRIAEKIESLLNKTEEVKKLIKEAKETLILQINAVLNKAYKGDLTQQWRKSNISKFTREEFVAQLSAERINLSRSKRDKEYYIERFNSLLLEQPKNIPNDWVMVEFELICDNITKGTTPKTSEITFEGDVPFLKVYNIVDNQIDFEFKPGFIPKTVHENKLKRSIVYPGDVLMNIVGPPLGKVAIVPPTYPEWNINQAIAIFRPIKDVLNEYIYYSLLYEKTLEEVFQGTRGVVGQSNISLEQCRKLKLALPPLEEQIKIVETIKSTFERLKVVENNINHLSSVLEKTEKSVMSKAFRGELGTNDLNDENAIELLKKMIQEQVK